MLIEILTSSFKILLILQLSENQTFGFFVQSWNWAIEFFELVPYSLFIKKIIRFDVFTFCLDTVSSALCSRSVGTFSCRKV